MVTHLMRIGGFIGVLLSLTSGVLAHSSQGEEASGSGVGVRARVTTTRLVLEGGAELITLFSHAPGDAAPVPILSVLRDTLGDEDPENDLLRYVWVYTYAPPTLAQRIVSMIPFLYHQMTTRRKADAPPPILVDLSRPRRALWQKASRLVVQNAVLDSGGWTFRALPRTAARNADEYREMQIAKALAILSLYEEGGETTLSSSDVMRLKIFLSQRSLMSAFLSEASLAELTWREKRRSRERRAMNWDFLRQRAEEEGLVFEPLGLPGEAPSHALLWIARDALRENFGKRGFSSRFLNIANPWTDERLLRWSGYTKTIYLDEEDRRVTPDHPGARAVELIPLALYGLDFPKIPILLADFRNALQVKAREASGKILMDSARYLLNLSPYGDVHFLLTRSLATFVTRKKGWDILQPNRLKAAAELSALLLTDAHLDPHLKQVLARKVEKARASALENSLAYQPVIAARQHEALVRAALQERALARRLEADRQQEYVRMSHGRLARALLAAARVVTLGFYTHREEMTSELRARYDIARRLAFHRARLEAAVRGSILLDVEYDPAALRPSLEFIRAHAAWAGPDLADLVREVLARSRDPDLRRECVLALAEMRHKKARKILMALERDAELRALVVHARASSGHPQPDPRSPEGLAQPDARSTSERLRAPAGGSSSMKEDPR